ncbi:pilus assembly protein TadG-related protein [Agrobacterium rosae]|uniref:TadE/TadG family type IV pilus assembly protein n=1 Tax=Agrobacterium rosae TaxID=1972867 RepID=UPI003BA01638
MVKNMRALLADRQGNFAMMTAVALPLLMGVAGGGLEFTRAMQVKSDLQNSADAATLAAATKFRESEGKLSDEELKGGVASFIGGQSFSQGLTELEKKALESNINSVAKRTETTKGTSFKIATTVSYQMPLNPLLGMIWAKTLTLSATSTSESSFNKGAPMSMYLVLDRSGSMSFRTDTVDRSKYSCPNYTSSNWGQSQSKVTSNPCYVNKSTSLKTAVSYLVDTLNKADPTYQLGGSPESKLVRTAAVAYSDVKFAEQGFEWGTKKTSAYVQAIPQYPEGGTNANIALNTAYDALKSNNTNIMTTKEGIEQGKQDNKFYNRYIVLMTDGEMTGSSSSWSSTIDTQVRATCTKAKADDIKIFTIAFMAPDKGKALLQACATSIDNYYAPENMEEIVEAFGDIARKASGNISRLTN